MVNYEKRAFWKFFSIYFISVALLILVAGRLYYKQQMQTHISHEQFSIIWYARMLKMSGLSYEKDGFSYSILNKEIENFDPQNLKITDCCIEKIVPGKGGRHYLLIKKDRAEFDRELKELKLKILAVELVLLSFFALLSALLARISLKPMRETITRLDRFTKDLIHDLNTPITSILLNLRLLKGDRSCGNKREIERIQTSVEEIASLYKNLNILLEQKSFKLDRVDISAVLHEMVQHYSVRFPSLHISVECDKMDVVTNESAIRQVLHNLLTNACKYNTKNGEVKIWTKGKKLFIKDSGVGIENVDQVFFRHYKEQKSGRGIGLHIVKTLCDAMGISVEIESKKGFGTVVTLLFPK